MIWVWVLTSWVSLPWLLRSLPAPDFASPDVYSRLVTHKFWFGTGLALILAAAALPASSARVWWPVASLLVVAAAIDLRTRFLPTVLIGAALVAELFSALAQLDRVPFAVAGMAIWTGSYLVVWRFGSGLGFGDIRLAGALGFASGFVSVEHTFIGMALASMVGAIWAWLRGRRIPFGPAMVGSCLVVQSVFVA